MKQLIVMDQLWHLVRSSAKRSPQMGHRTAVVFVPRHDIMQNSQLMRLAED
jgi:hypothetical protein